MYLNPHFQDIFSITSAPADTVFIHEGAEEIVAAGSAKVHTHSHCKNRPTTQAPLQGAWKNEIHGREETHSINIFKGGSDMQPREAKAGAQPL